MCDIQEQTQQVFANFHSPNPAQRGAALCGHSQAKYLLVGQFQKPLVPQNQNGQSV